MCEASGKKCAHDLPGGGEILPLFASPAIGEVFSCLNGAFFMHNMRWHGAGYVGFNAVFVTLRKCSHE